MTIHIDVREANERFLELIERTAQGEEITIERDGQPIARLTPLNGSKRPRQFGSAQGLIKMADDFDAPLDDFADYR